MMFTMAAVRKLTIIVGLGAILGACGGDTPEAVQQALQEAAPNLAFVEEGEGDCVAEALFDQVGFEQLALEGHSSETIRLDPAGSIATINEAHDSEVLRSRITECLDVDERFSADLESQHLREGLACSRTFAATDPLVDVYVEQIFAGDETTIEIEDTATNRDLLRECASEADFAEVFDLSTGDELAEAIDGSFKSTLREDRASCAGPLVVDAVGYERLNELGFGADSVRFDIADLDLEEDALDALVAEIAGCTDFVERATAQYRMDEPYFGSCVLESVQADDEWLDVRVGYALGLESSTRSADRVEARALDTCTKDRIEEVFGEYDNRIGLESSAFAYGLHRGLEDLGYGDYGFTRAEYDCMTYGLFAELGADQVYTYSEWFDAYDESSNEYWEADDAIWGRLGELRLECVGAWLTVAGDIERAGFSDETLDCVRNSIDVEQFAEIFTRRTFDLDWDAWDAYVIEFDSMIIAFDESLEDCYTDEDQSIYNDYDAWRRSFDATGETGDLVQTVQT